MHDPIVCTCIHTAFEKDTCDLHMSYIICLDVAGLRTSERRQIQESLSGDGKAKRIASPTTVLVESVYRTETV